MKMIQEFKGLRRKMKGKDRWKRNEKISLRNKRLSKKIRGSKRFRIRFRRNWEWKRTKSIKKRSKDKKLTKEINKFRINLGNILTKILKVINMIRSIWTL
jgi:hypothetical protein